MATKGSLRAKIVLWFVFVFFVIQIVLVGGVVVFRRGLIERSREDDLTASAAAMVENILASEVAWETAELQELVPTGAKFVFYALRDEEGTPLATWNVAAADALPFSAWEAVLTGPLGGVHTSLDPAIAERITGSPEYLRLATLPFRRKGDLFYFQAAARERALDRWLGPYVDLVVIGVPLGLVAAMLAAWIIAGRAVAPMERFSRAARDVSPTRLGERFDVPTGHAEVERLEDELNSALARIEEGYRAQDQFISNVSHELRTPIAALLTQAQVAKMGERDAERAYAFVDRAEELLKRLGTHVESFLVLARADLAGQRKRDPVELADVVLGCAQNCQAFAEQSGVRVRPSFTGDVGDRGFVVHGDAELLQTMLDNLVQNAIGHSPRGGVVDVEVAPDADGFQVAVRDEGPGIEEQYLDRVFDRFVRAPREQGRRDGVGLGLAIASSVAHLHGGTISVANNPAAAGCTFTVRLPRGSTAPA